VHRVEDSNNQSLFKSLPQGVGAKILLEASVYKRNLRRDLNFEVVKGRQRSKLSHRSQVQEREHRVTWAVVIEK
jgi:hypothetical protein